MSDTFIYNKDKYQAENEDGIIIKSVAHRREWRLFVYLEDELAVTFYADYRKGDGAVRPELNTHWTVSSSSLGLGDRSYEYAPVQLTIEQKEHVKHYIAQGLSKFPLLNSETKSFVTIPDVVFA